MRSCACLLLTTLLAGRALAQPPPVDGGVARPDGGGQPPLDAGADATFDLTPRPVGPAPSPRAAGIRIAGVVLVRGSRDPLPGVSVSVDGQPAAETDGEGRFTFEVSAGRHTLQIQYPGYDFFTETIDTRTAPPGALTALTLRLTSTRAPGEYETVIRAPPREAPQMTLEKSEITMTPGSLGDPFRVIESLPGVVPVLWPLPVYAVRGSNPGNTGYFLDGLRVPALFHFALGPAAIHPHFLETLTFYPSAYPASYGRYVGGVVAAETTNAPGDRARGSIDVRLFDAAAMLSTPVNDGKGTVAAAARYAYPAGILSLSQEQIEIHYWDYQARLDHSLGPGLVTVMALGSYDSLTAIDQPFGDAEPKKDRVALTFHRLDFRWRAPLAGGRFLAALGVGYDRTSAPYEDEAALSVSGKSLLPRLSFDRALGPAMDLTVGADGELTDYDAGVAMVDTSQGVGAFRARQAVLLGAYASLVLRAGERFVATPGLRLDSYRESGAHAWDVQPRLHLRYRLSPRVSLKASGGRATQLPSIPLQLPGFEGFGLPRHGLQMAWQGSGGFDATLPGALELDLTGFVQRMRLTDIRDPDAGDPVVADFLINRQALSYGLELLVRRPARERLHGWISYTLSRALRAFEGGVVSAADWDQRHVLNVVTGYRWRRYTLGGRFHLHSGRQVEIADASPVEYAWLPAFYQLDVRLDRRFVFDRYTLNLYVEMVNTTLTRQVVGLRQTTEGIEQEGFRLVLPSIGLRADF